MHRMMPDLEARDPGALALRRLEPRDPLAPLADRLAQQVELGVEAAG
jgi:hypothetical protein